MTVIPMLDAYASMGGLVSSQSSEKHISFQLPSIMCSVALDSLNDPKLFRDYCVPSGALNCFNEACHAVCILHILHY